MPDTHNLALPQLVAMLSRLQAQEAAHRGAIERAAAPRQEPAAIKTLKAKLAAVEAAKPSRIRDIFFGPSMTAEERSLARQIQDAEWSWRQAADAMDAAAREAKAEMPGVLASIKEVQAAISRAKEAERQAAAAPPATPQDEKGAGWLYALKNPMFEPDVLKVGLSTRTPEDRAIEISSTTGVPVPYTVAHQVRVTNCREAERRIHTALKHCRLSPVREFFRLSLAEYARAVDVMLKEAPHLVPPTERPATQMEEGVTLGRVQFKGTPTWPTVDTKKKPETRPNGRPWVPPWVKQ